MKNYNVEDIEFIQKSPNNNKFSCTITSYDHLKKQKYKIKKNHLRFLLKILKKQKWKI